MIQGQGAFVGGSGGQYGSRVKETPAVAAGIFLVDKPVGPTSFRIVQQVRRALGIKKVGHAGTLDPFASGLLIVCAGRPATRIISRLMEGDKEYEAVLRLGIETDTGDIEGKVVSTAGVAGVSRALIEETLTGFLGRQLQTPPRYSALKHRGKPLYYYARRGVEVVKEPRPVMIHRLRCLDFTGDTMVIRVVCGKGTYIRTLGTDIGRALGCGAHLAALRRLRSGPFSVAGAVDGTRLTERDQGRDILLRQLLSVDEVLNSLTTE